ncbi:hypothetical protein Poli38472_000114 [Pythium oligandrum]|uniref:CCHC-type domain-containing protein n=1 Tax=Pythium oligandrum TaxID=41045 RepID=A0A8K1CD17_PYTOL|nr:hypothetical protein Poli38472_000114 [Pythium oligandrum]|eukprot:TMW60072.1 hypothetical protein Poli38472_000114 [Pythium oligandrum]
MISFDTFIGSGHAESDSTDDDAALVKDGRRGENEGEVVDTPRGRRKNRIRHVANGRVQHLFQLLSLKNHTGDAKQALVQRLLNVTIVKELLLSKADQDQIASAANDAITEEILATVDMEDKRRKSISSGGTPNYEEFSSENRKTMIGTFVVGDMTQFSTYRVLELVDVLDSTTGGLVKRILLNIRRQRSGPQHAESEDLLETTEFCGFCVDYRGHNTRQHRCRICGALGQHRSQYCTQKPSTRPPTPSNRPPTPSNRPLTPSSNHPPTPSSNRPPTPSSRGRRRAAPTPPTPSPSRLTPDSSDKSYCTFCSTWGFHSTENHRCRNCSVRGEHRSRHCPRKASSEGYRWRGSPADSSVERKFCDLCGSLRGHSTEEHRCRICLKLGDHRSKNCPMHTPLSDYASPEAKNDVVVSRRGRTTPNGTLLRWHCSFCTKEVAHRSEEHICRICRATGLHRSGDCPSRRATPQSVLSYSVEKASKVGVRVLETIPLVLPASAAALVYESVDKVGDVDAILRRTLHRIGVWGGGSQTPITTPYLAQRAHSSIDGSATAAIVALPATQGVEGHGVYVLSYAEGRSMVPERILKYMRLLMHHEISTNAFSVVVRFDPRPSHWELQKPGMVTPRSLPSSPTMSEQLKKRMAKYTLSTLLGAREKLVKLVVAQKKLQEQHQQTQEANHEAAS